MLELVDARLGNFDLQGHRPKILVGICSCSKYPEKRQAVRETWLTRIPEDIECNFFIGGSQVLEEEPDTVVVAADDSYHGLPEKVLAYFAHALAHSDFEWLFKCDDDTYVALERLHDLITGQGDMIGNVTLRDRGSPSGGAGYLLSRQLVERVVADRSLVLRGPEDLIIGEAAVRHGAVPVWTGRLHWSAIPYPRKDNDLITAHWCSPEQMTAIHEVFINTPLKSYHAIHSQWRDRIDFHKGGTFARASSGCTGRWSENEDGTIALRWFEWGEEILVPEDDKVARVVAPGRTFSVWPGKAPETIVVWVTNGRHGLPHLQTFQQRNPGIRTHVVHTGELEGSARHHAWRNCDRLFRKWWLEQGNKLGFDRVVFLEWDVLFDANVNDIFPPGHFVGCDVHHPGTSNWIWFSEIRLLPQELQSHAVGHAPFAVVAFSRECLSAIMDHPLAEDLYEQDIISELRTPTLAAYCGYPPTDNRKHLPWVSDKQVPRGPGPGVWHSVK